MPRDRQHFTLSRLGSALAFNAKGGGSGKQPSDISDRANHAEALLRALDALPDLAKEQRAGVYLEVIGRPGEVMITKSLNASGLTLLRLAPGQQENIEPNRATVFASSGGIMKLKQKIEAFAGPLPVKENGSEGRPKNADLVQSIGAIVEANLPALWRSPKARFPSDVGTKSWEVWLDKKRAEQFISDAKKYGVAVGADRIEFPEDLVVIATATCDGLARAIKQLGGVRALAAPTVTADHFDGLEPEEQIEWVKSLVSRATFDGGDDPNAITLLDTGVSRAHPLIAPALHADDRHAADPAWGVEDSKGHGTNLAGLALYGDLTAVLQGTLPITIRHRLESAKIIPDAGSNPHHLLGAVTRAGVNAAETAGARRRTFVLASTTVDDTPHDGAPTSWSSELDQLTGGVSGIHWQHRLLVVSAGNSDQNKFGNADYLSVSDHTDNELESPAQAWNAISIGAFTEKNVLPPAEPGNPFAPAGDLSPSSRTASWISHWPIKPEVVFEGGNWVVNGAPPPMRHSALSTLTTCHKYPERAFTTCADTSGATALAAKAITELWADYPELWPETVRAIFVSSARWTTQMRSHLPARPVKGDYTPLFRRYGYGVPEMERARKSASNALTLIVEDTITPYRQSNNPGADHIHNEMKLFKLPWPVEELRKLHNTPVKLRIALSTFIRPNPSEPARV